MSRKRSNPDLTLVNLIHHSLRADGTRLAAAIAALDPGDRPSQLPGIQAFFDQYRGQLVIAHATSDQRKALFRSAPP